MIIEVRAGFILTEEFFRCFILFLIIENFLSIIEFNFKQRRGTILKGMHVLIFSQ